MVRLHRIKHSSVHRIGRFLRLYRRLLNSALMGIAIIARRQIRRRRIILPARLRSGLLRGLYLLQQARVAHMRDVRIRIRLLPILSSTLRLINRIRRQMYKMLHVYKRRHHKRQARLGTRKQGRQGSHRR